MNGKGDAPRPIAVDMREFDTRMLQTFKNRKDWYREAVITGKLFEWFPHMTGNWSEDRDEWLRWCENSGAVYHTR